MDTSVVIDTLLVFYTVCPEKYTLPFVGKPSGTVSLATQIKGILCLVEITYIQLATVNQL